MAPEERLRALLSRARLVLRVRAVLAGLEASCALGIFLILAFAGLNGLFGARGHAWAFVPALSALLALVAAGVFLATRRMGPVYLAWRIERGFSGFDSFLITAAESLNVSPFPDGARILLSRLERQLDAVSPSRLPRERRERAARVALAASLVVSAALTAALGRAVFRSAGEFLWGSPAPRLEVVAVYPGDAALSETDHLETFALVSGGPESVVLRLGGEEFSMSREGELWRARVSPGAGGEYVVKAKRGKDLALSRRFVVRVVPAIEAALSFRVRPPRYTRLKETVLRGPHIRIPEGSDIDAVLTGETEARFTFGAKAHRMKRARDGALHARLTPRRSGAYEIEHSRGRFAGTIVVVRDSLPDLSVAAEGLEGERLAMRVRASDDYGLGECTVHVSARGLSKEFRVPVAEGALEYSKKLFVPEGFVSSLPDGTEIVYWAEARDLSPERHVVRTPQKEWTLRRPESRTPLFASRKKKRKLRDRPRRRPPPPGAGQPPPPGGRTRGMETLEEEPPPSPPPPSPASAEERAGKAADYVSEQTSPEQREPGSGAPSPREAGAEGSGKRARPSAGSGAGGPGKGGKGGEGAGGSGGGAGGSGAGGEGAGSPGGSKRVQRPRDGGQKTGRETGPGPEGRETVDERLVDSVVPDPGEVARALAAGTENVGGGRGKRSETEGEDASAVPQASRLTGALGFSDGAPGTGAADYDELYRELAREYLRFAPRGR